MSRADDSELTPVGATVTDAAGYESIDALKRRKRGYLRLCKLQSRRLEFLDVGVTGRAWSQSHRPCEDIGGVNFFGRGQLNCPSIPPPK